MSVYTEVAITELEPLLAAYQLGEAVALTPIQGGIENSNYFLSTQKDGADRQWVLTLFEELSAADAAFLPPLLQALSDGGVPVAVPLKTQSGEYQPVFFGKTVQVAPRLAGTHLKAPGPQACLAMGEALAKLHSALQSYPLERANAHGPSWWQDVADRWRGKLGMVDRLLLDKCLDDYAVALQQFEDLPQGLIHGDLFRDNCLFQGDAVSGVLDFSETSRDHLLLDIAITMNDFCRAWPHVRIKKDSMKQFLAGYESVRALTADEYEALPTFLSVAAMRFWLSRLDVAERNQQEGRVGEHVLQKDPNEMRDMMADRLSF